MWCTRLERAKDQCEKNRIEEEMRGLGPELVAIVEQSMDQREVLVSATRMLQAMVDVISSNGWLNLALLVMEATQMVTQGMWERVSTLLQLPHSTKDLANKCQEKNIETIFDLVEMEDEERQELLMMEDSASRHYQILQPLPKHRP